MNKQHDILNNYHVAYRYGMLPMPFPSFNMCAKWCNETFSDEEKLNICYKKCFNQTLPLLQNNHFMPILPEKLAK
jgi:hypothetical protein